MATFRAPPPIQVLILSLVLASHLVACNLVIYESGRGGKVGPTLTDGLTFCVKDFTNRFINVRCTAPPDATSATFFVDNVLESRELAKPFFLKGDRSNGAVKPWRGLPSEVSIRCVLNDGTTYSARVKFACGLPAAQPTPSPTTSQIPPVAKPTPMDPIDVGIAPSPGVSTPDTGTCVLIDAKSSSLSLGWKLTDSGVVYRKGVKSRRTTRAGVAPLHYGFMAPATSRYAFIVEMTTAQKTEHNDVWAEVAGGFSLMRNGEVKSRQATRGFIKVYQNSKKRKAVSSSVDKNPHSISTFSTLEKGKTYDVTLSGRSSRVVVHRIIMFPCAGKSCDRKSSGWKNKLEECLEL